MMQLSEIHDPAATQAAADRSSSLNSSGVRVSTTSGKRSRPSSTASSKKSSALGSSRGGSGGDGDARSATSNRASFFGRMSSFGASGGPGSTLRDTFFGKARSDPLEDSSQNEFNLTVIDEEGLIEKPSAQIIAPRLGGCCGEKWSTAGYIVVGIAVLALVTTYIATLLSPTLNGYDIDPGLVLGSLQTLFLCAIVVITYNCVQVFQAHPNPIIMYKCVIDMVLAMRFLLDPWLLEAGVYSKGDRSSCAQLSGFTQFLYFSSDCMYFALIVDLYKSLTNPFTSVQGDRKKYMVSVCLAGMASGLLTALVKDFHGFADGNYCWTHRGDSTERNFWKLNVASWTVFYDWMIVFYLSGIGVLIYGMRRLRSGLKVTLDSRLEMLRHSAISIMSFTGYWTIAFSWYAISFSARTHYEKNGQMSPSKVFRTYSYTLAGRGVVDYFVWFMINKPSRMKANWMQFTSESADKKFSAQLNTALQRELIFFTIEGMTKAVQIADEELLRSRERSPTQELVLGHDDEEKEEERGSVASFQTPSTAPVMNLSYAGSEAERASIDSSSTTASKKAKKLAGQHEAPDRRSFLSTMGFSRGTSSNLGVPPGSVHKSPFVEPPPPPSSYTSEQHIKFTPYRSETFAELRSACGIKTDDFLRSFESSTKPSISEGASGAFMFFSGDKKFIVKSMAESECRFLCDIADDYVDYLIANPWSLITKFYGCFKITLYEKKFYFVVMENLFDVMEEGVTIHHRYDIKGSWVNRSYSRPRRGAKLKCRHCSMQFKYGASKSSLQCPNVVGLHEPNVVLKDNDLRTRMRIGSEAGKHLYECLREDSLFLCSLGIMDYSLLLGVTDIEFMVDPPSPKDNGPHERRNTVTSRVSVSVPDKLPTRSERTGSGNQTSVSTLASSEDASFTSLGGITHNASHLESVSTARATATYSARSVESFHSSRSQNVSHRTASDPAPPPSVVMVAPREKNSMRKSERVFGPGFYYIGIIDILQTWTLQKRMERFWKVHVRRCDPNGLSAIDPVRYQRRFEAKLREIIAIPKDMRGSLASPSGLTTRQSLGIGSDAGRGSIGKRPVRGVSREDSVLARLRMHAAVQEEDDDEDVVDLEQGVARNPEQILMRVTSSQRRATGSSGAPLVSGSAIQAV